jgi:hypothetical protein
MAKKPKSVSRERHWSDLQGDLPSAITQSVPWSVRFRRLGGAILLFAFIVVGGLICALYLLNDGKEQGVRVVVPKRPVRQVVLNTDGVLKQEWLQNILDIQDNVDLREVDIRSLVNQLLQVGQVRSVRVRREYPDQIVFDVQEYHPFAKMVVMEPNGERKLLIVSPEGHVYNGISYPLRIWQELPFLSGVEIQRTQNGFLPVAGMDRVVELWRTAGAHFPHFLSEWKRIDISGYNPRRSPYLGVIKVRSKMIPEIVFTPREYRTQLEKLDNIQYRYRNQLPGGVLRVDLTSLSQGVVMPAH